MSGILSPGAERGERQRDGGEKREGGGGEKARSKAEIKEKGNMITITNRARMNNINME